MNCSSLASKGFSPILMWNGIASEYKSRLFEKEWMTTMMMMAGSKNVGTRLGWRDGCVGRRLWKATDGRRRLYTRYTILPPNHHHHLLMPSYATLSPPRRSPVEIVATRDGQPCVISLLPGVIRTMLRGIYVPAQPSTVTQCQTIFVSVPARPSYSAPTQVEIDVCKSPSAIWSLFLYQTCSLTF